MTPSAFQTKSPRARAHKMKKSIFMLAIDQQQSLSQLASLAGQTAGGSHSRLQGMANSGLSILNDNPLGNLNRIGHSAPG